jgi:hypothetical protein
VGEVIFLGSTRKAQIHLNNIRFKLRADEKIDSEIHRKKNPLPFDWKGRGFI